MRPVVLAPIRALVAGLEPPNQEHLHIWGFSRLTSRPLFSNVLFLFFLHTWDVSRLTSRPLFSNVRFKVRFG
jgi:hypothetical protein